MKNMKTDTNPIILDGRALSEKLYEGLKCNQRVQAFLHESELIIITAGNDPASEVYVRNKIKACEKVGLRHKHVVVDENMSVEEFDGFLAKLLSDNLYSLESPNYHLGVILQLPAPQHMVEQFNADIPPIIDVDGFGYRNREMLALHGNPFNFPATPKGIMTLLNNYNIPVKGKHVVIIGRSDIVGKPLATMMLNADATVTVCHSKTKNLAKITKTADILIVACGKPKFIKAEHVKKGVTIVDVGINRTDEGLCGDVDFEDVKSKCHAITPVPGGVGPMTVYSLIENTLMNT
jgi:methylenetetrahydrofolate dehydrogenase (NADP+)/methenyltetrahydrofolate cyclohydrolase